MNKTSYLYDIPYGCHERHKLDLFIPQKTTTPHGVILFIHGGGWHQGDKTGHRDDINRFSSLGYICAAMNYRYVAENINVFDELDDITAALKAIKIKCQENTFDVDKLMLVGGSAGSHLALLYAVTRMNEAPIKPAAACVYCPPVKCYTEDFLLGIFGEFENWKYEILSKCCGCKLTKETFLNDTQQKALKKISPMEYLSDNFIPTAVFHGKKDELIPLRHIEEFTDLLSKMGVKNDLLIFSNSSHSLDQDPDMWVKTKTTIADYANAYLK
jgi:acetyl esterase/lipase